MTLDTDRLYKYAFKIAKQDGEDLLHHCLANSDTSKATDIYSYLYSIMRNEYFNAKSNFNKTMHGHEINRFDNEEIDSYDINELHTILMQLETSGLEFEVMIFKECKFSSNIATVSKIRNISKHRLRKIIKQITDEITTRYTAF